MKLTEEQVWAAFKEKIAANVTAFASYNSGHRYFDADSTLWVYYNRPTPWQLVGFFPVHGRIITVRYQVR